MWLATVDKILEVMNFLFLLYCFCQLLKQSSDERLAPDMNFSRDPRLLSTLNSNDSLASTWNYFHVFDFCAFDLELFSRSGPRMIFAF